MRRAIHVCIAVSAATLVSFAAFHGAREAEADLVNPVLILNAPLLFIGTVDDTVAAPAVVVIGGGAANWSVVVEQAAVGGAVPGANDIIVTTRHNIAPHAGEAAPNVTLPPILFDVVPGGPALAPPVFCAPHPGQGHDDCTNITYTPVAGVGSVIRVEAEHKELAIASVGGQLGMLDGDDPVQDIDSLGSGPSNDAPLIAASSAVGALALLAAGGWAVRRRYRRA